MMDKIAQFWDTYRRELTAAVRAKPSAYALRPEESAEDYAAKVAERMRAVAESNAGFGQINYRDSSAMRRAAKAVGVPFTRAGLDSLYRGNFGADHESN